MAFVVFEEKYKVGHADIDRQHARLFEAVNQLHDAMQKGQGQGRKELGTILEFLRNYTVEHFKTEERLMAETGYPDTVEHAMLHADLTQKVLDLEAKHSSGATSLTITVLNFLKDWLAHHISAHDRKLADHIRARAR